MQINLGVNPTISKPNMTLKFLSTEEEEYILTKANLLKVKQRLNKIGESVKETLARKDGMIRDESGIKIELSLYLDDLSPDKLDIILPELKKLLTEYHKLRDCQKELEAKIRGLSGFNGFEVTMK